MRKGRVLSLVFLPTGSPGTFPRYERVSETFYNLNGDNHQVQRAANDTLEKAETTSIVIITLSSIIPSPAPAWILITGIATLATAAAIVLMVVILDHRKTSAVSPGNGTLIFKNRTRVLPE